MIRSLKFSVILVSMAVLAACGGPRYKTVYHYQAPDNMDGRMCVNQCLDSKTYCERTDRQVRLEEKKVCLAEERIHAEIRYDDYLQKIKEAGEKAEKAFPISITVIAVTDMTGTISVNVNPTIGPATGIVVGLSGRKPSVSPIATKNK